MTIRRFREGVLSTTALRFLERRDRISHAADRLIFNSSTALSFTRIRSRTCRHQEIVRASLKHCDGAVAACFRTEREKAVQPQSDSSATRMARSPPSHYAFIGSSNRNRHLGNKRTCAELNSFENSSGTRVAVIVTRGGAVTATEKQIAHRVLLVDDDLGRGSFGVLEPVIDITYACDP
jgi:hypothetical protein